MQMKQIDESGHVAGIIDFEGATIAPLWECALLPRWLQDPDDPEGMYEGGSLACRQTLRTRFLDKVGDGEWRRVYESGRPFRLLRNHLCWQMTVWATEEMKEWVNERLSWAKDHPGVGFPESVDVAASSVRSSSPRLQPRALGMSSESPARPSSLHDFPVSVRNR
jgi:hypothetical protein